MKDKFLKALRCLVAAGMLETRALAIVASVKELLTPDGEIPGGVTPELEARANGWQLQLREGSYICPCCEASLAAVACPTCAGMVPPAFCMHCGCIVAGGNACPACAQPAAAMVEAPETAIPAAPVAEEARAEVQLRTAGQRVQFELHRDANGAYDGYVEAYVTAEVVDSHGTLIPADEVLRLLPMAEVDQMHDGQAIEGVRHTIGEKVYRNVNGKETAMVKVGLWFDQKVKSAEEAFQRIVKGTYEGLSIAFLPVKTAWDAVVAGVTQRVEALEELPFFSLVDAPSCAEARILNYRRKVQPPATSPLAEFRQALAADQPPAQPEPQPAPAGVTPEQLEAALGQFKNELKANLESQLATETAEALRALKDSFDAKLTAARVTLEAQVRALEGQVKQLRIADAPRRPATRSAADTVPTEPTEPEPRAKVTSEHDYQGK